MKYRFILFAILVFAAAGIITWWLVKPEKATSPTNNNEQVTTINDANTGMSMTYKARLFEAELSEEDKANKVFFRLMQPINEAPLQFTIRTETGKQEAANVTKQETRVLALESAKLVKPNEYESYDFVSEKLFEINGRRAAELVFKYGNETAVTQRVVIIEKDSDTIVILTAQSKTQDFEYNNDTYFEDMIKSVRFE